MYRFVFILLFVTSCANQDYSEWRTIDLEAFEIDLPPHWRNICDQLEDGYSGKLTNGKDTLFYYYGWFSPVVGDENRGNQNYTEVTVNGKLAVITIPEKGNTGLVGMSIAKFKNGPGKFFIGGSDITHSDQIIRMFKSIKFHESDTSINPSLTFDKFEEAHYVDGKALFQANCASCHHPVKDVTGPAFKTIAENRSIEWIVEFVSERDKLKEDSTLIKVLEYNEDFDCVRFPALSKEEIMAIFNFVSGCSGLPIS